MNGMQADAGKSTTGRLSSLRDRLDAVPLGVKVTAGAVALLGLLGYVAAYALANPDALFVL